jgi:PAS domain S-box-containing protein
MQAGGAGMTDTDSTNHDEDAGERIARLERRFEAALAAVSDAFYAMDEDWRIVVFNAAAERYFGFPAERVLNKSLWDVFPQGRGRPYEELCHKAKAGERSTLVMPSALRPGRSVEITFARWDEGVCIAITDVTDRQSREAQVRELIGEVNHRSKNLLAVVQAVARQTAARDPKEFVSSFEQRLRAVAKAQDLLTKGEWRHVGLEDLIRAELDHFSSLIGERISLDGPTVALTSAAAQSLGMAFHELATNAAKYGALSNRTGAIALVWRLEQQERGGEQLVIVWRETGGPAVTAPTAQGFGASVIGPMVRTGLAAEVDIEFRPEGLCWRMRCSAERCLAKEALARIAPDRRAPEPKPPAAPTQSRGRILVVEDEPLVGMEIADALADAGFTVLGPVASNEDALGLLAKQGCDGAVLDVNLGRETSEPLALKFAEEGVPFVTLTGYSAEQVPRPFRQAVLLTKPVTTDVLVAELADRLTQSRRA